MVGQKKYVLALGDVPGDLLKVLLSREPKSRREEEKKKKER